MKINLDVIKYNLDILEEVKLEFPILQDYEDGKYHSDTVNNLKLDLFVSFINFMRDAKLWGQKVVYDEKITYKKVKDKIVELSFSDKSKKIFSKKRESDFIKIFNDSKTHHRYSKQSNQSYCRGLEVAEPIIINYFIQKEIDFNPTFFKNNFYFTRLAKPKSYPRELKMTQELIDNFINFTKSQNFDLRKCNIKSVINELSNRLRPMMSVERDLQVKCIEDFTNFTKDKLYVVSDSRINYFGFLEIKVSDDRGSSIFVPYSHFEEMSRKREDFLKDLGI